MNLLALYQHLAACAGTDGVITMPTWESIAKAAQVQPTEDTQAFRALVQKGAIERRPLGADASSDSVYVVRRPAATARDAFAACLRTIGATVHHLDLEPAC